MTFDQRPSPNNYALTEKAYLIFLHTTLGSYEGAIGHLRSPENGVSAHFVIGRNGETAQLVQLGRGAWHAGVIHRPSKRAKDVCRKYPWGTIKNPNKYSIGIENAAGWDIDRDGIVEKWEQLFNPTMITRSAQIILFIEEEQGFPIPDKHILTHKDVTSYKPDLEIQRSMVLATLKKLRGTNQPDPVIPLVEDKAAIKAEIIKLINSL